MRMIKKGMVLLLAIVMLFAMVGCGNTETATNETATNNESTTESNTNTEKKTEEKTITLTFMHYLEQYQEQSDKLIELYKAEHPNVDIKIEIIGADYDKILQTRVATDEVPDIFMSGPFNLNERYAPVSFDFDGQPFLDEVLIGAEYRAEDGRLTGIPFTSQAWGIFYNVAVFEEAGITTAPLTLSELEEAIAKIEAIGVIPFGQGYKSGYVKNFLFGFPFGVEENYAENIEMLKNNEKEYKDFEFTGKIFDTLDLIKQHTQPDPFNDDFASAAARLGLGETAMMTIGDWAVGNAKKANPDAEIGIMPLPMSEDPADAKVYAAASTGLHVYKDSENLEAALEFVEWIVSSETAKKWLSEDMKAMSSIKGVSPVDAYALNQAIDYINEGRSGDWASYIFPNGIGAEFASPQDLYLLGEITREEAIDQLTEIWNTYEE